MHFYNRHKNLVLNLVDHETSKVSSKRGFHGSTLPFKSIKGNPRMKNYIRIFQKSRKSKTIFCTASCAVVLFKNLTTLTRSNKGLFSAFYVISEACFSYFVIMRKCCTISVTLLYICINVLLQHIFCDKWIMLTDMHEQTKTKPLIG